jgi:hypothetical protein
MKAVQYTEISPQIEGLGLLGISEVGRGSPVVMVGG